MPRNLLKLFIILILAVLIGYNSIYFRKLDQLQTNSTVKFDASSFAQNLWSEKFPARLDSALELNSLVQLLHDNPLLAFEQYFNSIAIGNFKYGLVKSVGIVTAVNEDDISLEIPTKTGALNVRLVTEFIYGNTIRDASKLVDIKELTNNADINSISEALNSIIREQVVNPFKKVVQLNDKINFIAAIALNKEHFKLDTLELIPVKIKLSE